jgi:hypothetical membrane protein
VSAVLTRLARDCGIAAPLLWFAVIFLAGALRPGYSHVSQYISELAERGSPTAGLMRGLGFYATGVMHVGFAAFLVRTSCRGPLALAGALLIAVDGLSRIGAGFFPCDPGCAPALPSLSQQLHGVFARSGFLAMTAAAFAWGLAERREKDAGLTAGYSLVSGGIAAAALLAVVTGARERVGLYELVASGTLSLWLLVFAIRLAHRPAGGS